MILPVTLCWALLIAAAHFILSLFGSMFREWVYILSAVLTSAGLLAGIGQLIWKIRKKALKRILLGAFICLFVLSCPALYLGAAFGYAPEHVVERDGVKYVAYVNAWLRTRVDYYDYQSFLTAGNRLRVREDYGRGGFDPIKNRYGYAYRPLATTYYDENGSVLYTGTAAE